MSMLLNMSFDGMVELWLKILQNVHLAFRAHLRVIRGPAHRKFPTSDINTWMCDVVRVV